MQKDEIIQLHSFLFQVRSCVEDTDKESGSQVFLSYDTLGVGSHHVFKSKDDQKLAVFELSKGLAKLMTKDGGSPFQQIIAGFEQLCNRLK